MSSVAIPEDVFDVIILGGGPAGFTAGIYAARAGMKTLLLSGSAGASQITYTPHVENFPGFPDGVGGYELIQKLKKQAEKFGLQIKSEDAGSIRQIDLGGAKGWEVQAREAYRTLALINGTGTSWRKIGIPGEDEFVGRGISYCATCDAPFFRNRQVAVIGGGDTAIEEACFLTKFATKVTIIHRRDKLRATEIIQKRAFANEKVGFVWDSAPEEIAGGDDGVTSLKIRNLKTGEKSELKVDGVFIFIGLDPNTELLKGIVEMDKDGYIRVDRDMKTSAAGIFACGDCTAKLLRQVITACGDGATAAFAAQHYVKELKGDSY
jgi:thioredoxin reductase (NADPH)